MASLGAAESAPPIFQYWDSEEIPGYIADLLDTFRARNSDMRHLVFNEGTAAHFIAEHFGKREIEAFRACVVPAMQADYFRYCAVYVCGGVYADADFLSRRRLRPLLDPGAGHLFKQPGGPVLNGLFAFRAPRHPLLAMAIEIATRNIESRAFTSVASCTGPLIFSGLLRMHRAASLEQLRNTMGPRWLPLIDSFAEVVEEHGPLSKAFERVRISSRSEMLTWVAKPEVELPYKAADRHWKNHRSSIFRSSRAGSRQTG